MKLKYEDMIFLESLGIIKSKEWYMQRIVKFVLNMTSYEGEWMKGFYTVMTFTSRTSSPTLSSSK